MAPWAGYYKKAGELLRTGSWHIEMRGGRLWCWSFVGCVRRQLPPDGSSCESCDGGAVGRVACKVVVARFGGGSKV